MAKVQIKSEQITPFGGIFCVMEEFDALLSNIIDSTLGPRTKTFGYQYSEIFRSLMCVYFCGGSCVEDISTHLMSHLSFHPVLRSCSTDTISPCHQGTDRPQHNLYVFRLGKIL